MSFPVNGYPSIEQMTHQLGSARTSNVPKQLNGVPFSEILQSKEQDRVRELRFSKHAYERLASRNIDMTDEQLIRLEEGAKRALEKGIKESLVMVDNLAFIVSITNNTVITAVGDDDSKVFTNIDGAVIV
ncbi:MAG: flagellar protein [Clostridiales bacterium]|nr:flagellar protein [Clostridiales bacterium]